MIPLRYARISLFCLLLGALIAAPALQASQNDIIGCIITNCLGGGGNSPPPPPPPPPPVIGSDPTFFPENYKHPTDDLLPELPPIPYPVDPARHAFSMIGDSRTHLGGHWDRHMYLGQYRDETCSGGKNGIHNDGWSGSTAEDWDKRLLNATLIMGLSNRVVAMIGGNDVINRVPSSCGFVFNHGFASCNDSITKEIHGHVKNVVHKLVLTGREVIYQEYFDANPMSNTLWRDSVNAGLHNLNNWAYNDFGPEIIRIIPAQPRIVGWKSACITGTLGWCPVCIRNVKLCVPMAKWEWSKPKIIVGPLRIPGVTYARIRTSMPASWFMDDKHFKFDEYGYQAQASDLHWELQNRCWW